MGPLAESPDQRYICYNCVQLCIGFFDGPSRMPQKMAPLAEGDSAQCSFCGINYPDIGPLAEGPEQVYICHKCLRLCANVIQAEIRRLGEKNRKG